MLWVYQLDKIIITLKADEEYVKMEDNVTQEDPQAYRDKIYISTHLHLIALIKALVAKKVISEEDVAAELINLSKEVTQSILDEISKVTGE